MKISALAIQGLFGTKDIAIPVSDNRLVLVGVNGIGKSTVLSIFYAFVSLRWDRLRDYDFRSIEIVLNDKPLRISKEEIVRFRRITRALGQYPAFGRRPTLTDDEFHDVVEKVMNDEELPRELLSRLPMSASMLRRMKEEMTQGADSVSLFSSDNYFTVRKRIRNEINATVLYLPTYRRIEKDLSSIFPGLEEAVKSYEERSLATIEEATFGARPRVPLSYIDLVQFGMNDIERIISRALTTINFSARAKLNELSGV